MTFKHKLNREYFTNNYNSVSFLKFIESAVLSSPGFCIKYYHDCCGTCGCTPFKSELKKYSDKVIIDGLNEFLKEDSETYYINLIRDRNKDENYSRWDQFKFEDAIGLCLEKIADEVQIENIEGTPLGFFHHQKISDRIGRDIEYRKREKIEARQKLIKQEKEKIEAKKRQVEHLKRIKKYKKRSKDLEI